MENQTQVIKAIRYFAYIRTTFSFDCCQLALAVASHYEEVLCVLWAKTG